MDMDDDDFFLYGESKPATETEKPAIATSEPQPISVEQVQSASNGLVQQLEMKAAGESNGGSDEGEEDMIGGAEGEGQYEDEEEEESEDDVEIIMEPASRSLDFRQQGGRPPPGGRTASATFNTPTRAPVQPQPSLTTEYTPRERAGVTKLSSTPQPNAPAASVTPLSAQAEQKPPVEGEPSIPADTGPDPSTLPVATAPPSHPNINPSIPGTLDGRSILEVDLNALAEKPWRRPGSDLSDWFNYGFDEISWEAYCFRRREVGELASVLKGNVLNFAGMPEEQLASLPPEIRTMVMAGATAMMSQGGGGPPGGGMIPPGAGMNMGGNAMMNQMMNMNPMMNPMMQEMGVIGMSGEMGQMGPGMAMGGPGGGPGQGMGGGVMQDGPAQGMGGGLSGGVGMGTVVQHSGGTPEQMGMVGDGFGPGGSGQGQGMMGMGMGGGEFGMQEPNMGQQMYPGMEGSGTPGPGPTQNQTRVPSGPPSQFRGRGMPPSMGMRGNRGTGFAGRGRALPVRPASPLPPNVPTGPRNKNKYKDIDGSAPAVDGLDYGGGGAKETGRGTPDYDERSSRKRRGSPGMDDGRGSKRR